MTARRTRQAASAIALTLALTTVSSQSVGAAPRPKPVGKSTGTSTTWTGNGTWFDGYGYAVSSGNDCAEASPYVEFVLASVKGLSNPTIRFADGPELTMTKSNGGKRGVGSYKYVYQSEDLIDLGALRDAGVTASWTNNASPTLTVGKGCGVYSDLTLSELQSANHQNVSAPVPYFSTCTNFAGWDSGVLRATSNSGLACGSSTWADKTDLSWATSIEASFSYDVSSTYSPRADGIALVIQDTGTSAIGLDGYTLGYLSGGMANSLAVAFRTWTFQNIVVSQNMTDWEDGSLPRVADAGANTGHDVRITITRSSGASTGELKVYLDGSGTAALTTTVNWPTSNSFLGFTGGVGGAAQTTTVDAMTVIWHN